MQARLLEDSSPRAKFSTLRKYTFPFTEMGPLQLGNQVVQKSQTEEQMTHWDKLNKENSKLVALFIMSPVCHLLSSLAILYHMIAQLEKGPLNHFQPIEPTLLHLFLSMRT